ncbi:MAG: IS607 family transposase [Methanogenium sp.]|jgi:predicted site-specific integrase-resolvase
MKEMVRVSKACEMLGISINTIKEYGILGKLKETRTTGGHRRYLLSDIHKLQGITEVEKTTIRACCYCRVSSNDQKQHGDLERQKLRVLEHCSKLGYVADYILVEVCSGMKSNRPKLNKLYELVITKQIDVLIIEHKDRLTRFMFDVFKEFFASHNVKIICVEEDLSKTFENELVSDIISLMTSFTATIHSRRKRQSKEYRKRIEQDGIKE